MVLVMAVRKGREGEGRKESERGMGREGFEAFSMYFRGYLMFMQSGLV